MKVTATGIYGEKKSYDVAVSNIRKDVSQREKQHDVRNGLGNHSCLGWNRRRQKRRLQSWEKETQMDEVRDALRSR